MIDPVDNLTVDMPLELPKRKRRYGPEPLSPELKRNHCVSVRMNDGELAKLDSERGKTPRGEWLRRAWSASLPMAPTPALNREAWVELSRAASNLNQIAKYLNEGGEVRAQDVLEQLEIFRNRLIGADFEKEVDE